MTSDIFVAVVAFLGFVAGAILKNMVPEEQKPGKKYLVLISKIILLVLAVFLLVEYMSRDVFAIALFVSGIVAGAVFRKKYFFLGFALLSFHFVAAVLVFLFGIVFGNKKVIDNLILYSIPFLFLFLPINVVYAVLFAAGGILGCLIHYR